MLSLTFERALEQIAERAIELDSKPRFPRENLEVLMAAGIPQFAADRDRCGLREEIALVRALASADASTARILDGHFNGVERLALCAPDALRKAELQRVRQGELLIGVWGADPARGEGPPARIEQDEGALVLKGVKTFCSGAGGVQRALVVACDEHGARRVAYVNVTSSVQIDRSWYRASGLRSSESHRVEFCDTPVLAILGGENELTRDPWFSRDAVRTAATWAGIADCIFQATVNALGERKLDELRLHPIGRMRVARSTIDLWLDHSASRLQEMKEDITSNVGSGRDGVGSPRALAGETRVAIADAARLIAAEAARVSGRARSSTVGRSTVPGATWTCSCCNIVLTRSW
ncbi:MAG: acyl-CoA dehydrogenase family protein [Solirubrobacteraceae bacterium]